MTFVEFCLTFIIAFFIFLPISYVLTPLSLKLLPDNNGPRRLARQNDQNEDDNFRRDEKEQPSTDDLP